MGHAPNRASGACPEALSRSESGAPGRIRTRDPLIRSQMLYPLSYGRAVGAQLEHAPHELPALLGCWSRTRTAFGGTGGKPISFGRAAAAVPRIETRGDLGVNVARWARHLRAAHLSPRTIEAYLEALTRFATYLDEHGMPTDLAAIRREHVEAFIEDLLRRWKPATAANRFA